MADEFIEPTRPGKRYIALCLGILIGGGAFLRFWLKPFLETAPICDRIAGIGYLLVGTSCVTVAVALWTATHAVKILKLKQFPLAGTPVWRRTPILRGRPAVFRGYVGLLIVVIVIAMAIRGWQLFGNLHSEIAKKARCDGLPVITTPRS